MFNRICAYEYKGDFAGAKSLMDEYMQIYPLDKVAADEGIFLKTR